MSRYYNNKKSRRERIGFYTALTICLIAICMAVYSTYSTVNDNQKIASVSTVETGVAVVNESVTNITVPVPTIGEAVTEEITLPPVTSAPETTVQPATDAGSQKGTMAREDALETMLAANVSLSMPTESGHIMREFSRDSVYYKTLNTWKPHLGLDFDGELGDDVTAMLNGEVTKVTEDKMYGKTVEISLNNVVTGYCGLGEVKVKQGEKVDRGDKLGTIGAVPAEASDKNHIHVYVKVNNTYADPVSFINYDNE